MEKSFFWGLPLFLLMAMAASMLKVPSNQLPPTHNRAQTLVLQSNRIDTLIPIASNSQDDARIYENIFDSLLALDQDGKISPRLAQKYEEHGADVIFASLSLEQLHQAQNWIESNSHVGPWNDFHLVKSVPRAKPQDYFNEKFYPSEAKALAKTAEISILVFHISLVSESLITAIHKIAQDSKLFVALYPQYSFSLRPGARFNDLKLPHGEIISGKPVSLEDLDFSLRLCQQQPEYESLYRDTFINPNMRGDCQLVREFSTLKATDGEYLVELNQPTARNPWFWIEFYILPRYLFIGPEAQHVAKLTNSGTTLSTSYFAKWPIGSGEFQVLEHRENDIITLSRVANTVPHDGVFPIKYLTYQQLPDKLTQVYNARSGGIDILNQPSLELIDLFKKFNNLQTFPSELPVATRYYFLCFNARRKIFQGDSASAGGRLRRALAMAVPYDQIIQKVFKNLGVRLSGPFHPEAPWYDNTVPLMPFDLSAARNLLDQAGWVQDGAGGRRNQAGEPLIITITTSGGRDPAWVQAQAIIADAWKRLGVDVNIVTQEWNTYLDKTIVPFDFDTAIIGIETSKLEGKAKFMWHSDNTQSGGYNVANYREADELVDSFESAVDEVSRVQIGRALHRRIAAFVPYAFLAVRKEIAFASKDIFEEDAVNVKPLLRFPYVNLSIALTHWVRASQTRSNLW